MAMEANDRKAMREALTSIRDMVTTLSGYCSPEMTSRIFVIAQRALSLPRRNCDVGSEEEQSRRYEAFCEAHHMQRDKGCSACPCAKKSGISCELYWAQMPYVEKEGEGDVR